MFICPPLFSLSHYMAVTTNMLDIFFPHRQVSRFPSSALKKYYCIKLSKLSIPDLSDVFNFEIIDEGNITL